MNYSDNRHSHTAVASGYLFKVSRNGTPFARWHRRYYVLYSDGLLYSFKNARSKAFDRVIPVGRMCLRMKFGSETSSEDCASWPKSVSQKLCFSIINSDRAYHFFCESEREFDSWQQHLLGTLDKLSSSGSHWAVDRGDTKGDSQKERETAQIKVESEEDEQLTYDMIVHGYLERHDDDVGEKGKEEERKGEQHSEPTHGSVSEGLLAKESTAVNAPATLELSVEKVSEEKETGQGNVQALQVGKTTRPDVESEEKETCQDLQVCNQDVEREENINNKRAVDSSSLDERRTDLADCASLEEQVFIETVDPGVPKIVQLERKILSLYPDEDESGLKLKVEDMIESVFNEMTLPPDEYSPRKCECEEQKLSSNTTREKRSGGEMGLQKESSPTTEEHSQTVNVKERIKQFSKKVPEPNCL